MPRNFVGLRLTSKAIYFNTKLEEICKDENVNFSNFWGSFVDQNYLFRKDRVHLNDVGDARLGRLLDTEVKKIYKEKICKEQVFREGTNPLSTLVK